MSRLANCCRCPLTTPRRLFAVLLLIASAAAAYPVAADTEVRIANCDRNAADLLSQQPIRFAPGTADIDHTAFSTLDSVAEEAAQCATALLQIEGHTDSLGSESRNIQLSLARANTVAEYLIALGISPDRVITKGIGSAQPIADNASRDGRRVNRRVVIRFLPNTDD